MTDLTAKLKKSLEICEASTPGPCELKFRSDIGDWLIRYPKIPRGFHGDSYSFSLCADETDAQFFVLARNNYSQTTKALMIAIEALEVRKEGGCDIYEPERCLPCNAKSALAAIRECFEEEE